MTATANDDPGIPPVLFADLDRLDPRDVCRRARCRYDPQRHCYEIWAWTVCCRVFPAAGVIKYRAAPSNTPHAYFGVFVLHYLLHAVDVDPTGEWISVKDLPGGQTFFRGPHTVPTHWITDRFGNDLNAFESRCRLLDSRVLAMADSAYCFSITDRIPAAVLYWQGDADFAPQAGLLFDKTVGAHLALDIVYALAVDICDRLGRPLMVA